jgi:hypothetical protein
LSSELDALSSQVLEWEREALLAQEVSEGTGTGDAQAAEAEAQHRRIQEKQALLMEYHAKIGQLDRKVRHECICFYIIMTLLIVLFKL